MQVTSTPSLLTRSQEPRIRYKPGPWQKLRRLLPIYIMVLPGILLFLIWTPYPLIYALVMSFFQWNPNPGTDSPFAGLDNYLHAFKDPVFWQALGNVLYYGVVTVIGQMVLGLGVALLLNRKFLGRSIFRILYYLPVVTSWVVVSYIFAYLFSTPSGPVNWFFGDFLHLIPDDLSWLGSTTLALPTLMILGIWKGIGWNMMIFLAGLQNIPAELYEAARVDGANRWALFANITLPLLRSVITFVTIALTLGAFGTFIPSFLLTSGGPLHSTETLLSYAYNNAFATFDFGYGAALTYIFAFVAVTFSIVQMRVIRRPSNQS